MRNRLNTRTEREPTAGRLRRVIHGALLLFGVLVCGTMIVFASGCLARRWGVVTVPARGAGVHVSSNAVLFVVPMPAERLRTGELVVMKLPDEVGEKVLRIDAVSGDTRAIRLRSSDGKATTVTAPATVWRVRTTVPAAGLLLRALAGTLQAVLFILVGITLIVSAERRTHSRAPRRDAVEVA